MKKFDSLHRGLDTVQNAVSIEKKINNCSPAVQNLEELRTEFPEEFLKMFFCACICYWAETEFYDDRNVRAVLESRQILKYCPSLSKMDYTEHVLKNAFYFTVSAHRYLQLQLFKIILRFFEHTDMKGIYAWYKAQEFVLVGDEAVPYSSWLKRR